MTPFSATMMLSPATCDINDDDYDDKNANNEMFGLFRGVLQPKQTFTAGYSFERVDSTCPSNGVCERVAGQRVISPTRRDGRTR